MVRKLWPLNSDVSMHIGHLAMRGWIPCYLGMCTATATATSCSQANVLNTSGKWLHECLHAVPLEGPEMQSFRAVEYALVEHGTVCFRFLEKLLFAGVW